MEFVIKTMQAGKTTQLIKMAAEVNAYIIVKDVRRIKHIQTIAQKLKVKIPYPITISEVLRKQYYAAGIKAFMIDDVEEILHRIVPGVPILAVTGTKVPFFSPRKVKDINFMIKTIRHYLRAQDHELGCYSTKNNGKATLDCDGAIDVTGPVKPYCIVNIRNTYPQVKFIIEANPYKEDNFDAFKGTHRIKITTLNNDQPQEGQPDFKELPPWLQKLWKVSPILAREAEKDLGNSFYNTNLGEPYNPNKKESST